MTNNDYINQLASSLSESVLNLAKVGYADQFIAEGVEAYRCGGQLVYEVASTLPLVRENRQEFTAYFDDPSGRIVEPIFRRFDYETQRNLSRLARDYFQAVGRFEKWVQEGVCLGEKIREWGAALALVAELQRILHRPDETGTTLLKLHEKGKLNLFVDPNRGPEWRFLDDWESQRDAAANAAKAEAQRAISATMQHFDFDVEAIRLMLMRCFGKSMSACMGKPGDHYCNYRLNTSSLSSTWDIEKELKSLLNDVEQQMSVMKEASDAVNSSSRSLSVEALAAQMNLLDQLRR